MEREIIKQVIADQREYRPPKTLFKRLQTLKIKKFTDDPNILIITGIQALRLPKWESRFWLTQLTVWAIGASTLTYEFRKATWLILGLVIVSAALAHTDEKSSTQSQHGKFGVNFNRQAVMNEMRQRN